MHICDKRGSTHRRSHRWRKLRDGGVHAGKKPSETPGETPGEKIGEKIGRLTPEQVEIAGLCRQLDITVHRLVTTRVASEIM